MNIDPDDSGLTVGALIAQLQRVPRDARVYVFGPSDDGGCTSGPVRSLEVLSDGAIVYVSMDPPGPRRLD